MGFSPRCHGECGRLADRAAGITCGRRQGTGSAATAAAEPPDEPPASTPVAQLQGFTVGHNRRFSVDDPMANSSWFSLPSSTPHPTGSGSRSIHIAAKAVRMRLAACEGTFLTQNRSLTPKGMPSSAQHRQISLIGRRRHLARAFGRIVEKAVQRARVVDGGQAALSSAAVVSPLPARRGPRRWSVCSDRSFHHLRHGRSPRAHRGRVLRESGPASRHR